MLHSENHSVSMVGQWFAHSNLVKSFVFLNSISLGLLLLQLSIVYVTLVANNVGL